MSRPKQVIFKLFRAIGDVVVFTNLIQEFGRTVNGNGIRFDVLTPYPEITYYNPYLTRLPKNQSIEVLDFTNIDLEMYRKSGKHYSTAFIEALNEYWLKDKFRVEQSSIYPSIYMTPEEKNCKEKILAKYGIEDNYWLINCGNKIDIPLKAYPNHSWGSVISGLKTKGIQLVQVGSHNDFHMPLEGVKSLIGKTENLRDFLNLCQFADGAITPISALMHIMAAFRKPTVVLAGGRETPNWEMYSDHRFFSSVGILDCCKHSGCWHSKREECTSMVGDVSRYPLCMVLIRPEIIVDSVLLYNEHKCL